MNECEFHMDNCHENATCNDTIGSFICTCNTGFEGDGVNCDSESDFVLRKVNEEKIVSLHLHHMEHSTSVYRYQLLIFTSWNRGGKI